MAGVMGARPMATNSHYARPVTDIDGRDFGLMGITRVRGSRPPRGSLPYTVSHSYSHKYVGRCYTSENQAN